MKWWCFAWLLLHFVEADDNANLTGIELICATPMHRKSPNGRKYTAFEGIRYRSNVDTGTFRYIRQKEMLIYRAVPKNSGSNDCYRSLNRRVDGIHIDPINFEVIGRKDCAYINIYTPDYEETARMPVLIWIHGTQFSLGSPASYDYDPWRFMDHNIVVVTMSYRLDVIGFVRSYFHGLVGNYGLDDQRVAIEWVTKNIENFGGDPRKITLAGHGAGAAHALFHLKRPTWNTGEYAIKRGIAISGTRFAPWAREIYPYIKYNEFQDKLIETEKVKSVKQIVGGQLERLKFLTLIITSRDMMHDPKNKWDTMLWPFKPVATHYYEEPGNEWPSTYSNFSLLLGLNRNEGDIIYAFARKRNWTGDWKDIMFKTYTHSDYYINRSNLDNIKDRMETLYEQTSTRDKRVGDMMSDGWFLLPAIKEAAYHQGPIHGFMFDFQSQLGLMKCVAPRSGERTSHGDELPYIFYIKKCIIDRKNKWVAQKYVGMLARFVIHGDTKLKKYQKDKFLFDITDQLRNPESFKEIDRNLSLRVTEWYKFY